MTQIYVTNKNEGKKTIKHIFCRFMVYINYSIIYIFHIHFLLSHLIQNETKHKTKQK